MNTILRRSRSGEDPISKLVKSEDLTEYTWTEDDDDSVLEEVFQNNSCRDHRSAATIVRTKSISSVQSDDSDDLVISKTWDCSDDESTVAYSVDDSSDSDVDDNSSVWSSDDDSSCSSDEDDDSSLLDESEDYLTQLDSGNVVQPKVLPSPANTYKVVCLSFLEPNVATTVASKVFDESLRMLRPGGLLYVVDNGGRTVQKSPKMRQMLSRVTDMTVKHKVHDIETQQILAANGFAESTEDDAEYNSDGHVVRWMGIKPKV